MSNYHALKAEKISNVGNIKMFYNYREKRAIAIKDASMLFLYRKMLLSLTTYL